MATSMDHLIYSLEKIGDQISEYPNTDTAIWHLNQAVANLKGSEVFRYRVYLPDNTTLTVEHHRKLDRPRGFVYQFGGGVWTTKGVGETTKGPAETIEVKAELIP